MTGENAKYEIISPVVASTLHSAEIDVQIATAKRYPRDIEWTTKAIKDEALKSPEVAASMFYVLRRKERDGKIKEIFGPSVRLAEIVGRNLGNMRIAARVIDEGERFVTAQAVCHDLEANYAVSVEKVRRVTTKDGRRYSDDMVLVTMNAALSFAFRDAIFRVASRLLVNEVYSECRKLVASDTKKDIEQRRKEFVEWFARKGASESEFCELAGVKALSDLGESELVNLRFLATSIQNGEITIAAALHQVRGGNEEQPNERAPLSQRLKKPEPSMAGLSETESVKDEESASATEETEFTEDRSNGGSAA